MEAAHDEGASGHGRLGTFRADAQRSPRRADGNSAVNRSLHTCPPCYPASAARTRVAYVAMQAAKFADVASAVTPHPRTSRAILNCGLGECASHVRTDRPHPAPKGAGLARVALRPPVASLPSRGFPPHAPVRGAFALPRPIDRGFALGPHQGASPLEPDKGLSHPSTTRRRLSRPGTHDQSLRALDDAQVAFMPLHPDGGGYPLDPAAGTIRQKGGALDR